MTTSNELAVANAPSSSPERDDGTQASTGEDGRCPIVGIGASAGGLEALKQFLSAMPGDSGAAFVLIQHLDPKHDSLTAEILSRCTEMPVVQVEEPMAVEANRVYVIPPNTYLNVRGNGLHLSEPVLQRGLRMPIDSFFRSLAEEQHDRAIGIVVSGTGTDGTLGIKAIKGYGGLVIAQDPESAQHDGMPRSAIATGLVDVVRPVEAIPDVLCRYLQHAYIQEPDQPQRPPPVIAKSSRLAELTQHALLQDHAPAAVLVDRKHQILHFHGPTTRFLHHPAGAPTHDVLALVRDGLLTKLRAALHQAAAQNQPVTVADARVNRDGAYARVKLTVKPVSPGGPGEDFLLITFEDLPGLPAAVPANTGAPPEPLVQQLEYELKSTREDLQSHIEEQEASNEELQAANEEVMSVNEELQSTNEELETSKEELQSLNEELTTVNNQLKDKVEELELTNDDLANLLSSSDIATVFLDTEQRIKGFTPASKELFHLIAGDVGRPLDDIRQKFENGDVLRDVDRVLEKLTPLEHEVRTTEGQHFIRRVLPYRTADNRIGGVVITFVDITERKRTEEQTRRLAAVVRDSNDAITVQDFDGQIIAWNRGAERMYGWTEEEALAMNIVDTVPEAGRGEALAYVEGLARGEAITAFETQRLTKDGRTLDVWLTVTPLLDEAGRPSAIATTERDISERKQAEANLRNSEKNFRAILESAPDAMLIIDETGVIQLANSQSERLFGYPRDELLGMAVEGLMPERFRAAHGAHRDSYFAAPQPRGMGADLTLFGVAKDGHEFPIEVSLSPIDTQAGLRVSAAVRDVTDRKQAEGALREQKALSDSLVETAQAIILLLDPEGRVLRVNPYLEQLTGYRSDEVVGMDWFETFLPEEDQATIHALIHEMMRNGVNPRYTNPIVARDGSRHAIEWRAKILHDGGGNIVGLLNVGHDVTERIQSEQALEASKREAERADAAKSRFLAAASHDLRQPLQTISLLNEILVKMVKDPDAQKAIDGQHKALSAIEGLIGAYLDISKLDAGVIRPTVSDFPVETLFARLRSGFEVHAQQKGLELRILPCSVSMHSDPALLQQIVENLIGNALRHARPPGRIVVGARRRGERIRLEVWDTGVGIPADQLERIFEEFHQLENPARAREGGLGLGLAIAERMAKLLGHTIDVRSTVGKGSVFAVEVPRGESVPARVDAPAPVAAATPASDSLLLLVDDDPSILDALGVLLQSLGYQVASAASGAQALAALERAERSPALIISDHRLPNETGLDVIRKVRAAVGRDLPAILMTGDTAPAPLREAEALGCRVLHKPARQDVLLPLIQQLLY